MLLLKILILAIVQGIAELLPVSSSAHVIVAERMLGMDPTAPDMTFLLVMLHTGTMFAVIAYFWRAWQRSFFASRAQFVEAVKLIVIATGITGVIGLALMVLIEKVILHGTANAEVESLFGNRWLIACGLATVGVLIVYSGSKLTSKADAMTPRQAAWIGAIQGLCLPFRGFSRSGATISTGLLLGMNRQRAEEFSFALAVVLTPVVILKEGHRLIKASGGLHDVAGSHLSLLMPGLFGMCASFLAGLLALRWLSHWLEQGRWKYFGYYCLCAAAAVPWLMR
ncbi:MAG: undecaprenyl-diphosphate phosphatase [Proteobacteria bacterium]|nr:undecaprenyl-diphosphate phosphatase [Pseudomonadota bacterium]